MNISRASLSGLDLALDPVRVSTYHSNRQEPEPPPLGRVSTAAAVHEKVLNGPVEEIKAAFCRLEYLYHKNVSLTFRHRVIQIQSGFSKGGKLLSHAYQAMDPLLSIFRNSVLSGEELLKKFSGFTKAVKKTRLFSVISIPVSIVGMFKGMAGLSVSLYHKKYGDAGEFGLNILDSLGDLSSSISTFIDGLEVCEVITGSAALTAASTYLSGIGTILSVAAIGLHSKFIYDTNKLKNRMIKIFKGEEKEKFKGIVDLFDQYSDSRLARNIGVSDGAKLKARMHAIFKRNRNPETNPEHKKNLEKTFQALKTRIKWNNIGRYLKITAAVITIVAMAVLMFSPLAPLGYALLAISTVIGLGVLYMDYKAERKLNDHFKALAPKESPEMWNFYEKKHLKDKLDADPLIRSWDFTHGRRRSQDGVRVVRQQRSYEFEDAIPNEKK